MGKLSCISLDGCRSPNGTLTRTGKSLTLMSTFAVLNSRHGFLSCSHFFVLVFTRKNWVRLSWGVGEDVPRWSLYSQYFLANSTFRRKVTLPKAMTGDYKVERCGHDMSRLKSQCGKSVLASVCSYFRYLFHFGLKNVCLCLVNCQVCLCFQFFCYFNFNL